MPCSMRMLDRVVASAVSQVVEGNRIVGTRTRTNQVREPERLLHDLLRGSHSRIGDDVDIVGREQVEVPDQVLPLNRPWEAVRGGGWRREEEQKKEKRAQQRERGVPHFQSLGWVGLGWVQCKVQSEMKRVC